MALISYDPPGRFIVGTIGSPGQREFYLQASAEGRVTSVGAEKAQIAILVARIDDLLDELKSGTGAGTVSLDPVDDDPLITPVEEEFRVGTMSLSWDSEASRLVLEMHAVGDSFDTADVDELAEAGELAADPAADPNQLVLRVNLPASMARAFARRGRKVVTAGRPQCPFCSSPIDVGGHICPRANGYRR